MSCQDDLMEFREAMERLSKKQSRIESHPSLAKVEKDEQNDLISC